MKKGSSLVLYAVSFLAALILFSIAGFNFQTSLFLSIVVFAFILWIRSGELSKMIDSINRKQDKRNEDRLSHERRQAELRALTEEEMAREIGRKSAAGEMRRREDEKIRRERQRQHAEKRRRDFFDNPLGIGR